MPNVNVWPKFNHQDFPALFLRASLLGEDNYLNAQKKCIYKRNISLLAAKKVSAPKESLITAEVFKDCWRDIRIKLVVLKPRFGPNQFAYESICLVSVSKGAAHTVKK